MRTKLLMLMVATCLLIPNSSYAFIFDTGEPFPAGLRPRPVGDNPEVPNVHHYSFDSSQNFAAQFHLDRFYTISSIEGFMAVSDDYSQELMYNVSIYGDQNDAPDVSNVLLAQTRSRRFTQSEGYQWDGIDELNFNLGPGTYWVAFETDAFPGLMAGPSPHPLGREAFRLKTGGPWDGMYLPSDDLDLSLRMDGQTAPLSPTVTPELNTILLLGGGLLVVFLQRQRRV